MARATRRTFLTLTALLPARLGALRATDAIDKARRYDSSMKFR
ncbi:MAG TPA: hypothetical protein VMY37_20385 [Thermoguttaceae bacterium]|nr:hypothetical protein [Thermoguttaceae bacterium]